MILNIKDLSVMALYLDNQIISPQQAETLRISLTAMGCDAAWLGLGQINNTADMDKPVSTAVLTALNTKAPKDVATTTLNGLFAATDKVKLNTIATGATANALDSALRDRSTHTGTQATSTVTGLDTALADKLSKSGGVLTGSLSAPTLLITGKSTPDSGGTMRLTAATNTTMAGDIVVDIYQDSLRFYDGGGSNKGFYLNLANGAASANKDLLSRSSHTGTQAMTTISGLQTALDAKSDAAYSFETTYLRGSVARKLQQIANAMDAPYNAAGDGTADDRAALYAVDQKAAVTITHIPHSNQYDIHSSCAVYR